MHSISRLIVVSFTLFGCVGCDQASKSMARTFLNAGAPESLLHDVLRLELTENTGAFLGLGASLSEHLRFSLFTGAVGILLMGIVLRAIFARRLDPWRIVALALIAGGGISNLLDRLLGEGRVTDFLNLGIGSMRTGIFNFADVSILAGSILFVLGYRTVAASNDRFERAPGQKLR
jgi:signal peptidase II